VSVILQGSEPRHLLSHLALYGSAAICAAAGLPVTVGWTSGIEPRPVIEGIDDVGLGDIVLGHASRDRAWLQAGLPHEPSRGLFSPRIKPPTSPEQWEALQQARHSQLDRLADPPGQLERDFLSGLGEPAYWYTNQQGDREPDRGATRYEMQPRNQGSEFVGTRLRPLAEAVSQRHRQEVSDGLTGRALRDELGGKPDSRSAVNFRGLGPADSALVWCALWGLSVLPVIHKAPQAGRRHVLPQPSRSPGHVPRREYGERAGAFTVPHWEGRWTVGRLKHMVVSDALARVGRAIADEEQTPVASWSWLTRRGIRALWAFPVITVGSSSAPERRALAGRLVRR